MIVVEVFGKTFYSNYSNISLASVYTVRVSGGALWFYFEEEVAL